MTESCGMCAILPPSYPRLKSVGVPVPSIEIKFKDVEDAGYFSTNNPPQGEILIRGNSVTSGYYKVFIGHPLLRLNPSPTKYGIAQRDDINKETFTDDGWLMTGDIGQWNSDGTLSIIDRKKVWRFGTSKFFAPLEPFPFGLESCQTIWRGIYCVGGMPYSEHLKTNAHSKPFTETRGYIQRLPNRHKRHGACFIRREAAPCSRLSARKEFGESCRRWRRLASLML